MATVSQPTAASIVGEGLRQGGVGSPTPTDIARGTKEWIPIALSDIWTRAIETGNTRLKSLEKTAVMMTTAGRRRYAMPEGAEEEIIMTLFCPVTSITIVETETVGSERVAFATNTPWADATSYVLADSRESGGSFYRCILAHTSSATDEPGVGANWATYWVLITAPSQCYLGHQVYFLAQGENDQLAQARESIVINSTEVQVDYAWSENYLPAKGDVLYFGQFAGELLELGRREYDHRQYQSGTGLPYYWMKHEEFIEFDVAPDLATYLVQMRYFANINKLDWDIDPMPKVFLNWRHVLTSFVKMTILFERGDMSAYKEARADYEQSVEMLIRSEIPYGGQFRGFSLGQGAYSG